MSFKLGDKIYKEILYFYAEDKSTGIPQYVLTQLSDANIEITAESKDVTDKNGNLVKKIWKSKAGTFSATNAFVNTNIVAAWLMWICQCQCPYMLLSYYFIGIITYPYKY